MLGHGTRERTGGTPASGRQAGGGFVRTILGVSALGL
jgi:hypothetical protein